MRYMTSKEAADIGRKGGRSGKGKAKTRPKSHYKMLVELRRKNAAKRKRAARKLLDVI